MKCTSRVSSLAQFCQYTWSAFGWDDISVADGLNGVNREEHWTDAKVQGIMANSVCGSDFSRTS